MWNYLSIPKLQRYNRRSLGIDKQFSLTSVTSMVNVWYLDSCYISLGWLRTSNKKINKIPFLHFLERKYEDFGARSSYLGLGLIIVFHIILLGAITPIYPIYLLLAPNTSYIPKFMHLVCALSCFAVECFRPIMLTTTPRMSHAYMC